MPFEFHRLLDRSPASLGSSDFDMQEFLAWIRQGESDTLELKPGGMNLDRHVSAFANAKGGVIVYGDIETGGLPGMIFGYEPNWLPFEVKIRKIVPRSLNGMSSFGILIIGEAPESIKPVFTPRGEAFKRIGGQSVEINVLPTPVYIHNSPASEGLLIDDKPQVRAEESDLPEEVEESSPQPINVFVAMSFREDEEPHLVDYYQAMHRAAEKVGGISVFRVDELLGDHEIIDAIHNGIDNSDAVLVDYTLDPHNVYYEAGYARGKGKHIISVARKGTVLQFDTRGRATIFYANATLLEASLIRQFEALKSSLR